MSKERFPFRVAVHLILINDEKILLSRRFNTGYEDGNYALVSGHADGNETFTDAMIREAKEEIGIDIKQEDLKMVHVMHRITNHEYVDFFFECKTWSNEIKNLEEEKCDELGWFGLYELPTNIVTPIRIAIDKYLTEDNFSELVD